MKRAIQEQVGLPVLVYESSSSNPGEFLESVVMDRLETFFRNCGLTEIEEAV